MDASLPANIDFKGGSAQQRELIGRSHALAREIAEKARQAAGERRDLVAEWFGDADPAAVCDRFEQIIRVIGGNSFLYAIENSLSFQIETDLFFSVQDVSGLQLVVIPWKGLFLQPADQVSAIARKAACSIIHLSAATLTDAGDLLIVEDPDGARFLARWDADAALSSPRNYMYFSSAV